MQKQWQEILDGVIQFHTPISVLLERIRSRERQYEIREMSDESALNHLLRIESAQEYVISTLDHEKYETKIIHVNTIEGNLDQICNDLLLKLDIEIINRQKAL
jgi:hypothetical protein